MKPMNKTLLALLVSAVSMGAYAEGDEVKTKGGFQIKSEDGLFEAKIGGRLHIDANYFTKEEDLAANAQDTNSTLFARRARLSLSGRAYDVEYLIENDFAGQSGTTGSGFREVWIKKKVQGHNVRLGQAKPYRGMEELTSSNEIDFMERPFASANAMYAGRQFQAGLFVDNVIDNVGYGLSVYNVRTLGDNGATAAVEGRGYNARGYFVPVQEEGSILHLGASITVDDTPAAATNTNGSQSTLNGANKIDPSIAGRRNGLSGVILEGATKQQVLAGEFAFRMDQVYIQAEYAKNKADAAKANSTTVTTANTTTGAVSSTTTNTVVDLGEQNIETYYVQASYMLTDHFKPYDFKKGVFKSPKVSGGEGAWEVRARFDTIENKDYRSANATTSAGARKAVQSTLGLTYFATPNSRYMLEYVNGNYEIAAGGSATPNEQNVDLVQARAQFNF